MQEVRNTSNFVSNVGETICMFDEQMRGNITSQDCIKKWKNSLDTFVRELRKVNKRRSGEEGPVYMYVSMQPTVLQQQALFG